MSSSGEEETEKPRLLTRAIAGATIWIYPETGDIKINATGLNLPAAQKRFLACLASNPDRLVTIEELSTAIVRPGYPAASENNIRVAARRLRLALNGDQAGTGQLVVTGAKGYYLGGAR